MSRVWLQALALLAVAAALVALLVIELDEPVPSQSIALTNLAPESISRIRLERPRRDAVVLVRGSTGWRMTEPFAAAANPVRASALASLAGARSNVYYPSADLSLAELGLADTATRLHLDDEVLHIGRRDPVRGLRYVRNGERVFLLQDRFAHHLGPSSAGFVDPVLLPSNLKLRTIKTSRFELDKRDDLWRWQPSEAFDSADDATALARAWKSLSALSVSFADYRAEWREAAELGLSDGSQIRLLMRSQNGRYWLAWPERDLQYELPRARLETLKLTP